MTAVSSLLAAACAQAGIPSAGAELVRDGENQVYRLPGAVIVRVTRPGQDQVARREVFLGRWLNDHGIRAVDPIDVDQPVIVGGHPVTFWHELPPHRPGSVRQVAQALRDLHALPAPDGLASHKVAPFVRLHERIASSRWLPVEDRARLLAQLASLEDSWDRRPPGLPEAVIHGDAWAGNVIDADGIGVVLMDLERCTVGPPEWDLVSTACRFTSYGTLSRAEYEVFCAEYGNDVTTWAGFELFRDIRELRVTCFAAYVAQSKPQFRGNAQVRIDCLRGLRGPRPWRWEPIE